MTKSQLAVTLVALAVMLPTTLCAQDLEFKIPDGWVVSPENDKAEGEAGYRILHEETGIELLYVPGGTFMMGSADDDLDARADEIPQHEHPVEAFWIGRTGVTVGQWRSVMGSVPGMFNDQGDNHPVVEVGWGDTQEFCDKAGLRLPTEPEWEYAARGPENPKYSWGDDCDKTKCCNGGNRGPGDRTFPVGSFPEGASWCGALDMSGNVWEWCADCHDPDAYRSYAKGDLAPPSTGLRKVLRGGTWFYVDPRYVRCAFRGGSAPSYRDLNVGFRCARGL